MAEHEFKILVVIPFFNEEKRMSHQDFVFAFKTYSQADFLLLDDASSDKTPAILNELSHGFSHVHYIGLEKNLGKAECIRYGLRHFDMERYTHIAYMDADLSAPFSEVFKIFGLSVNDSQFQFWMGSRVKLMGNQIERSLPRHYIGRFFATIVSQWILKVPVYDTQCGVKVIHAALAKHLFEAPFVTRWLFDVELLLRFKRSDPHFESKTKEVPLETWVEKGHTKIKWHEFLMVPYQLLKLYVKYR